MFYMSPFFVCMKAFVRKKYILELELRVGKTVFCEFQQATYREILQFGEMVSGKVNFTEVIINFLNSQNTYQKFFFGFLTKSVKLRKKDFRFLTEKSADKIMEFIMRTYAKGYFRYLKKDDSEKESPKRKMKYVPDGAFIAFILEHTNETFETLLDMTYEAIQEINDGILWNLRSQSKEGQRENDKIARMHDIREGQSMEEALAEAKELERKLKLKRQKDAG